MRVELVWGLAGPNEGYVLHALCQVTHEDVVSVLGIAQGYLWAEIIYYCMSSYLENRISRRLILRTHGANCVARYVNVLFVARIVISTIAQSFNLRTSWDMLVWAMLVLSPGVCMG